MKNLSETEIKDILRNREQKIASIHKKMFSMYKELGDNDGILKSAALPAAGLSGMPGAKGGHKDLGDVLIRYNRQIYNQNEEIRKIMWELVEEEDSISRVWACFHALGDPYYSILHALYVENQLYQAVEEEFDASHKTFEKYRQRGMAQLLNFYNSGDSAAELMRRRKKPGTGSPKKQKAEHGKNKAEGDGYEQISLSTFLHGNQEKGKKEAGDMPI